MKITKVIGYGLSSPLKESNFVYYGYQNNIKNIGIVEVHTDTGLVGFGETYAGVYCAELVAPVVEYLQNYLVGQDINKVISVDSLPFIGRSGLVKSIYSGIEIALYDILSKEQNLPLWEYLGGSPLEPQTYASNGSARFTPEQIEEDVKSILDLGFTSYKMRIGLQSKTQDLKRLEAARKHLGNSNLMVDAIMGTNPNSWDYPTALQWSKDLNQFDTYWLEEPFKPTSVENYSSLNSKSSIQIAGGEALNQLLEFDLYYRTRAVDIIQPDVTNSGGVQDCLYVIDQFTPKNTAMHVWGSQVAINANYHIAKSKNVLFLEIPLMELEINDHINVPGPGIGINITDKIKTKYKLQSQLNFKI